MGRPIQLSVEDLSPVCDISRDDQFVILRSYFDGGNQPDSSLYEVLSLAAVSGTKDQWLAFEADWKIALEHHHAPWLHTTDGVSLKNEPFTPENGWDKPKRNAFLWECVTVVEKHLLRPSTEHDPGGRPGLLAYVITVVLRDFLRATADNPEVPKDVTALCATQAVWQALVRGEAMGAHFYYLIFDQNEPFKRHIDARQRNKRAKKHLESILGRITSVTEADMRDVPALQMADLFAWCYSHKRKEPHHEWQKRILGHENWVDDRFGYDALVKIKPGVAGLVNSWGLPPGRPTR